jgi:ribosome-interacting GTPase 1
MEINGTEIQLLDLPGIIEGAAEGKGRGKQVIATARTSDLVLVMLDSAKAETQRPILEYELETMGIRLNKGPPQHLLQEEEVGIPEYHRLHSHCKVDTSLREIRQGSSPLV